MRWAGSSTPEMWLYLVVVVLLVLGVAGGILAGGVFTIVLVPLALIVLVSGLSYSALGRAAQRHSGGGAGDRPLPHAGEPDSGHVRTSPERLADARRVEQ
jgi:hypothetical protein